MLDTQALIVAGGQKRRSRKVGEGIFGPDATTATEDSYTWDGSIATHVESFCNLYKTVLLLSL